MLVYVCLCLLTLDAHAGPCCLDGGRPCSKRASTSKPPSAGNESQGIENAGSVLAGARRYIMRQQKNGCASRIAVCVTEPKWLQCESLRSSNASVYSPTLVGHACSCCSCLAIFFHACLCFSHVRMFGCSCLFMLVHAGSCFSHVGLLMLPACSCLLVFAHACSCFA